MSFIWKITLIEKNSEKFSDSGSTQKYSVRVWDSFGVQIIIIYGLCWLGNFSGIVLVIHFIVGVVIGAIESFKQNGYEVFNMEKSPSFIPMIQNF